MSTLREMFERARADQRKVFLPFMTAGLPNPADSARLIAAMLDAGADGCEVGIPYTDPLMDGPVIQRGSESAIAAGVTIDRSLEIIASVVATTQAATREVGPARVVAMTYANPVFRRGVDWFCERLAEVGAAGVIVPDLPVEESQSLVQSCRRHGLGTVQFVAPTSDAKRIRLVAEAEPAFIYAVSEMGVTGERDQASSHAGRLMEAIRSVTNLPVVFGVGISTPDQARAAVAAGADGVIVGSALVRSVLEASDAATAEVRLRARVRTFVEALQG